MSEQVLWNSVYVPTDDEDKVTAALKKVYEEAGYAAFNPFPGGTGTPKGISERVRLFVAPGESNWARIIGAPDVDLLKNLSDGLKSPLVYVWIGEENSGVEVIGAGEWSQFLREGRSSTEIETAMNAQYTASDSPTGEVARLAGEYGVDAGQADKMFQKAAKTVFKKLDKRTEGEAASMQDAAKKSLDNPFSWGLPSAQRVTAIMECLSIPQTWREPSFGDLAAAYQIACLLDINEDAPLLPGDEAILDRVEYPLDYTPAYFAR
jgi:hypothetical protein